MAALAAVSILFVFGGWGSGGFLHFLTMAIAKDLAATREVNHFADV